MPRLVKEGELKEQVGFGRVDEHFPATSPTPVSFGRRWLHTRLVFLGVLLTLIAAFSPGSILHAQTGSVTGTVVDPSGASIPGAQVQLINQATGDLTRVAVADGTGTFRALNVPPATYKISISAAGMQGLERDDVVLDQEQNLSLGQVQMTIGRSTETITVNTETPLIDTASSKQLGRHRPAAGG